MDRIKASQFADLAYYSRFVPPSRTVTFAAPASTLTNFPALVKCNSTFNIGTSTGYDVHFQDLSGNELAYELDFYDSVTGNGAWWVQVPSLPSSGPTTIKMLYGDSSASTNGSSPSTIWADYAHVYHFTGLTWTDVAGSYAAYDSSNGVTPTISLVSNSITGLGYKVVLTSGYGSTYWGWRWGNQISTTTATLTVLSTSSKVPYDDNNWGIGGSSGWTNYGFSIRKSGLATWAGNLSATTTHADANGVYCYAASTKSGELNWYVDGVSQTTASATTGYLRWDSPSITGRGYSASYPTEIVLDELRVSKTICKSADWLQYEYNQAVNHSTYTTYGPEA